MVLKLAYKLFGSRNDRLLKKMTKTVNAINALEPTYEGMSDAELKNQTKQFRDRIEQGESLDNLLPEAFAVVRESAKRTLGQRHYDVQLMGGIALHQGDIAEMKTGEGKTLVATLAVYLNAISGKGVHVVTVNDYLAQRDAEWMGQVYRFLGMNVGCIIANIDETTRQEAYAADVTYGTNNEFGFDYLRDNMKYRMDSMVQRPFNFAIVDEVDSILIDEARTPLIISGPAETSSELYQMANIIVPKLEDKHYEADEKVKTVVLTDDGVEFIEDMLRENGTLTEGGLYDAQNISLVHHVNQALRAHKMFHRDTDYIVKDNQVIIIDEFTGRMMEGRRYSEGLHQSLEAKEGVDIQQENQTLASITFQNYFRMYPKLAGMTGTAMTEATEFADIYNLDVIAIPTNESVSRADHNDKIYKSLDEKLEATLNLIKECYEREQPVLVGTISIDKSEQLSKLLKKHKIKHKVLNARYHEQEAQIISQAGRPGAVTIATNMAGRGTDIQLGGNLDMRIAEEVKDNLPEDKRQAQIDKIKKEIEDARQTARDAGGLYVIGTERHESRRIDNQLRGRSGRQGDPGASIFFLSLEDDLMRIFGAEKMEALLSNKHIGLKDGEALTHRWISKALERAQARVEGMNYEVRKSLLRFDNVMNDQRKVIYEQRREIMDSDDVMPIIQDMRYDVIEDLVAANIPPNAYPEEWDIDTLKVETNRLLNLDLSIDEWAKEEGIADLEIKERLVDASDKLIRRKMDAVGEKTLNNVCKALLLRILDQHWKEHLLNLDHLRQGINLRAFAQRDPLNEYKGEAFSMFEAMLNLLREAVVSTISIVEINLKDVPQSLLEHTEKGTVHEGRVDPASEQTKKNPKLSPVSVKQAQHTPFDANDPDTWGKVSRNAECPCGSGKKFKHCHGTVAAQV